MKYRTRFVMSCAIAVVLVASVAAQDPLSKRVSLDLKAMAPADAFGTLASSVGLKAVVDPAVTAPIDILVLEVSARTALTTICESIGCEWSVTGGTLSIKPPRAAAGLASYQGEATYAMVPRPASAAQVNSRMLDLLKTPLPAGMKFENAPLATVSERLSQALGMRIELSSSDPALKTVTVDFSQKTLLDGLKELGELGNASLRLGVSVGKDSTGKELSPTMMIAIRKPGREKK